MARFLNRYDLHALSLNGWASLGFAVVVFEDYYKFLDVLIVFGR
jgi:hypothetical protein